MDGGRPHENNYELVYSAWRHQQRLTGHEEAQRLNALRPSLQQLRRSYRNDSVRVEYGGAIAEAYLLAYVPLYIHQAQEVLRQAIDQAALPPSDELRVGLLCPGPGPELIALVRVLSDTWPLAPNLHVTYFDIANSGWANVRCGLLQCANDIHQPRSIGAEIVDIDLRSNLRPDTIGQFADFDIVVAQNMVNEVADSQQALSNLRSIVSTLKPGALVAVSDLVNYGKAVGKTKGVFTQTLTVLHDEAREYNVPAPDAGPLREHFFGDYEDDLMWKRWLNLVEWIGVKRPERRT